MSTVHWTAAYVRGLAGALVAAGAGVGLVAAPFVFAYQPEGEEWVDASRIGVGALLVVLALLTAVLLADLRDAPAQPHATPADEASS